MYPGAFIGRKPSLVLNLGESLVNLVRYSSPVSIEKGLLVVAPHHRKLSPINHFEVLKLEAQ